jgi:hypothetical protein
MSEQDPTAVTGRFTAEGIAGLRSEMLSDPAVRADLLKNGNEGEAGKALALVHRLQSGEKIPPEDLAKLVPKTPAATEAEVEGHKASWGSGYEANLTAARAAAETLHKAGFQPSDVDTLQAAIGHADTLNLFLAASRAGGDPKAVAGQLVRQLLGDAKVAKAYTSGGSNSPLGRVVTALQRIQSGT